MIIAGCGEIISSSMPAALSASAAVTACNALNNTLEGIAAVSTRITRIAPVHDTTAIAVANTTTVETIVNGRAAKIIAAAEREAISGRKLQNARMLDNSTTAAVASAAV